MTEYRLWNEGKIRIKCCEISQIFFLLGIFMKQFYFGSSGGFQIGDFCFMMSAFLIIFFSSKGVISYKREDTYIIIYVALITLINFIYICVDSIPDESGFYYTRSILYYIYNLIFIFTVQILLDKGSDFLLNVQKTLKVCLCVQLIVVVFRLGKFEYGRNLGTFNDPNQCAFYVFASCLIIFIISYIYEQRSGWLIWYLISLFIIINTQSTGMLMGLILLLILFLLIKLYNINRKILMFFMVGVVGAVVVYILLAYNVIAFPESIQQSQMYARVFQKLNMIGGESNSSSGIYEIVIDRCWDRLFDYPEKLLYGAGEGNFSRFPSAKFINNEIHSSILGPLFYYGILPCSIWYYWIYKKIKNSKSEIMIAGIVLLIESVTLVNTRQPFFWMVLVLAGYKLSKKNISDM